MTSAHKRYDTRIFQKECRSLSERGYEVYLIVNDEKKNEIIDKVNIISTETLIKNRYERFFKSHKLLWKKMQEIDAELYHFHDPDLLPMALKMKKQGKKVIFDSHENVRENIKDKEYIPKVMRKIISAIYSVYENNILKKIDAVIGVTPEQMILLERIGNNATMITNYPEIVNNVKENQGGTREGICFAGGISPMWLHETILDAIEGTNIKYKLCGPVEKKYLEKLEKHKAWKQVEYLGMIKHEEVIKVLNSSIAGIALLKYLNSTGKIGTLGNTKIFEYMRAGIPLIATDFVLWKDIIEKYNCGICVNIENNIEIKKAIKFMIENPIEAQKMGQNGRKIFLSQYNWKTQVEKLFRLYSKIIN